MIFSLDRREALLAGAAALGAGLGAGLLPQGAAAQTTTATAQTDTAEAERLAAEFIGEATPLAEGLTLDLPVLGDNPSAVPALVRVDLPITEESFCEEIVVIAERNPFPLACRIKFTAATGSAEAAVRLRLIETMNVRALARMNDGRILTARREITVTVGGCGM